MFGIWLLERLFDLGATAVLLGLTLMLRSRMLATGEGAAWQVKFRVTGVSCLRQWPACLCWWCIFVCTGPGRSIGVSPGGVRGKAGAAGWRCNSAGSSTGYRRSAA